MEDKDEIEKGSVTLFNYEFPPVKQDDDSIPGKPKPPPTIKPPIPRKPQQPPSKKIDKTPSDPPPSNPPSSEPNPPPTVDLNPIPPESDPPSKSDPPATPPSEPSDPPATSPSPADPPSDPPATSPSPADPPSENKNNLSDEPQNNKELNMKEKSVIALFSMGAIMIRIPKEQVKFPFETELPSLCFFNDEKTIGIADEFDSQTNEYCIDVNKDKVFSYTRFDDSDIPDKVGAELYITADGKLTKTKGSNKKVGMFLAKKHNAILFKLD